MRTRFVILLITGLLGRSLYASEEAKEDTVHLDRDVVVSARHVSPQRDIIPVQTLSGEELKRLNSNSVADALRYFSGVQVKDYGGVGGIKTVNIRSMGTNHTSVVYDGVELGNAQNGQIDLGQLSLENVDALSLYNGQKSALLQPAKDFGSAGTVYIRARKPHFEGSERFHARGTLRTGSFDLFDVSALGEMKVSENVSAQLSAQFLTSSGKYKFRYKRVTPAGEVAYDTTAVRQNGDIDALRLEMNVNGVLRAGEWSAKVYHYNSNRGIPGAIVNNVWRRGERLWDNNTFAQAKYSGWWGGFTTLNNVKYAFYRTRYVNRDERLIPVDNRYWQQEVYLSSANEYTISNHWRASLSYDFAWNYLHSDLYGFSGAERFSNYLAAAVAMDYGPVKAQGSLLATFVNDTRRASDLRGSHHALSPSLFASTKIWKGVSARAFFKQSFRMPTFNDLYYTDMGNASLRPERVTQYNVGLSYALERDGFLKDLRFAADAYYNRVHDKIVAYPKGQQFRWTMLNLGEVSIRGVDANFSATVAPIRDLFVILRLQYTFQRAIDITNPADNYYRDQIPYIPRNSGSAIVNLQWRGWNVNYSWIYVGERYNQQENIIYNYMQPWYTSDLSLSYDFQLRKLRFRILGEINNLLSQDYDVILNYPMPKRNFRLTLSVEI